MNCGEFLKGRGGECLLFSRDVRLRQVCPVSFGEERTRSLEVDGGPNRHLVGSDIGIRGGKKLEKNASSRISSREGTTSEMDR